MTIKYIESKMFSIILCCFLSSCSVSSFLSQEKIPDEGLIAYYPFDQNANDNSGNHNDGEVNGAKLTNDRKENKTSAYAFDGVDDYIYVPDKEVLRVDGQITMSVWFKTGYSLPFAGIICKAVPQEPRQGYMIDINDYNNIRVDLLYDHSKGIGGTLVSNNDLTDNKWHHVLVSYDGKIVKLYIDGKLDNEMPYERGMQTNTEPLLIGWDECTWLSDRYFKGSIDDIRIYNRALNNKEVAILYKEKS
jgi:hypothetical protein